MNVIVSAAKQISKFICALSLNHIIILLNYYSCIKLKGVLQVCLQPQPKSMGMAHIKGSIILIIAAINLILMINIIMIMMMILMIRKHLILILNMIIG